MTEMELRQKVIKTAEAYLGCKESDGSHRKIIDIYNSHKPLAVGYEVTYTDAWCSAFISAISILCGLTDIIPTECGCGRHIDLFKQLGIWVEDDGYIPTMGDIILYNWNDSGNGDCTTGASHIGYVVSCNGKTIKIIEGNISNSVGYRTLAVNGKYIRGYAVPDYASKTSPAAVNASVRYNTLADLKADPNSQHYLPTVEKLIRKGFLKGKGGTGDNLILDFSEDSIRILVTLDRAGVYGE